MSRSFAKTLRRFFRTPKGLAIIVLAVLVVLASLGSGVRLVAPGIASGVIAAMLVDAPILRYRTGRWVFPDGALLTGLFVAMILSPHEPWHVTAMTSVVGVLSKYVFRVGLANVFNPAAFALVATFYVFDTGESWWGALPELAPAAIVALIATGVFVANRVNKMSAALSFLGAYYTVATVAAFLGNPARVAELYRAPDVHAALFFAFFMVTDPPTSPPKAKDQVVYGAIVAMVSYAVFELIGAAYFLLAGLLAANIWEAGRKIRLRRGRTARGKAGVVAPPGAELDGA
jgi:Na+-translocating ferredoxin:NAD+ oxidoreductase RnfD subunit